MSETSTAVTGEGLGDFFASTPSFKVEPPKPDKHRGIVTGVSWIPSVNGGRFVIGLKSTDTGIETDFSFFPPRPFINNIYAPGDAYSTEHPISEATGNAMPSEADQFGRHIQNSEGRATLQTLVSIAAAQGCSVSSPKPTNITELAAMLNELCTGMNVVFVRSTDKNPRDPQYASMLRVRGIYGPEVADNPKLLKNYQPAWE